MSLSPLERIQLWKAKQAADTVAQEEPVVTDGDKTVGPKEKNIKAKAPTVDVTITLPTAVGRDYETISITKVDATANDVIIEDIGAVELLRLTYQYQTAIFISDGTDWNLLTESSSNFSNLIVSATEPTDTSLVWVDTSAL